MADLLEEIARDIVILFCLVFVVLPILLIWSTFKIILLLNAYRCYSIVKNFSIDDTKWSIVKAHATGSGYKTEITYVADRPYSKKVNYITDNEPTVLYRISNPRRSILNDQKYWRRQITSQFKGLLIPILIYVFILLMVFI